MHARAHYSHLRDWRSTYRSLRIYGHVAFRHSHYGTGASDMSMLDSTTRCLCKDIKDKARTVGMSHMSKVETSAFILVLKWVLWSWTRVRAAVCFVSKITVQVCGFEDKGNEFSAEDFVHSLGEKTSSVAPGTTWNFWRRVGFFRHRHRHCWRR